MTFRLRGDILKIAIWRTRYKFLGGTIMDFLKKVWPTPFKIKEKDVTSFVVQLIIFIVVCFVGGLIVGLLAAIPIIGIIFSILGSLLSLYSFIGVVLCILKFLDVLK